MHTFTVDYSKDRPDRRVLLNRGFFVSSLPRLIPRCRILGHRPVVDGYDAQFGDRARSRWVTCDRCGVRPKPQGLLDADTWDIGQPYTGPFNPNQPTSPVVRKQLAARGHDAGIRQPGAWPARPEGDLGAQLIIGRTHSVGAGIKVGNAGSEHVLAGHIGLGPLGALYVHTERFGTGIQRRLNPVGYDSREIGLDFHHGRAWWSLWAKRDEHSASDPRWMRGSLRINPAHYLLGPRSNTEIHRTENTPAVVHLPDGTQYNVTVRMEKWQSGRPRGRQKTFWAVDWDCPDGIPVRNHDWKGDNTYGGHFRAPDSLADSGGWATEVALLIAQHCMRDRAHYGYRAPAA